MKLRLISFVPGLGPLGRRYSEPRLAAHHVKNPLHVVLARCGSRVGVNNVNQINGELIFDACQHFYPLT